jgi:hypothetical protein
MLDERISADVLALLKRIQNNCIFHKDKIEIQTFITDGFEIEKQIENLLDRMETNMAHPSGGWF